jgi:hypothetical protein
MRIRYRELHVVGQTLLQLEVDPWRGTVYYRLGVVSFVVPSLYSLFCVSPISTFFFFFGPLEFVLGVVHVQVVPVRERVD